MIAFSKAYVQWRDKFLIFRRIEKIVSDKFFFFLVIVAASFISYCDISNIPFAADDFLWLERAKYRITADPFSIFKSEGLYFDPLVYLLFRLNYAANGLDPAWYHYTDLIIHTINALLVAYLTLLLAKSRTASFFSGFIFAVWHTNTDSVAWPSSRVETLAALFYLSSLIAYIKYHAVRKLFLYYASIVFFIISLSAKAVPLVLPIIILALELVYFRKAGYKELFLRVMPFFLISIIYLILLWFASPGITGTFLIPDMLNTNAVLKGIPTLFFPESLIITNEMLYTLLSFLIGAAVIGLGILFIPFRLLILILIMISATTIPLLFLKLTYIYMTPLLPLGAVLGSIYHRLYLGITGFSILMGALISFVLNRYNKDPALAYGIYILLAIGIFGYGFSSVLERKRVWRALGESYQFAVSAVKWVESPRDSWSSVKKVYLIESPLTGFAQPIFRVYLDNGDLITEDLAHYSLLPDIRPLRGETAVLAYSENDSFIELTPDVLRYQDIIYKCGKLSDKRESEICWNDLPKITQSINTLITGKR